MITGILFMILVGLSWTAYGYVMGKAPKQNIDVSVLLFLTLLIALFISAGTGMMQNNAEVTAKGVFLAVGSQIITGIVNFFQLYYMSKAMQKGPNGIIWSIVQSGFVFPFLAGILIFGEALTWNRGIGLIILVISICMLGGKDKGKVSGNWRKPAFIAFLCTGISQTLSNFPSYFPEAAAVASAWRTAGFSFGMMIGAVISHIPDRRQFAALFLEQCRKKALWIYCIIFEILDIGVNITFLYPGMDRLSKAGAGAISYPVMVSSCLIFFELFALLILHEKRNWRQRFALALCIAGAILLPLSF